MKLVPMSQKWSNFCLSWVVMIISFIIGVGLFQQSFIFVFFLSNSGLKMMSIMMFGQSDWNNCSPAPRYGQTQKHTPHIRTHQHLFHVKSMFLSNYNFVLSIKCTTVFEEDNELTFKAGDSIVVLEKSHADWWRGSCNRRVGDFPAPMWIQLNIKSLERMSWDIVDQRGKRRDEGGNEVNSQCPQITNSQLGLWTQFLNFNQIYNHFCLFMLLFSVLPVECVTHMNYSVCVSGSGWQFLAN